MFFSVYKKFGIKDPNVIEQRWSEPHRYFHTLEHLHDIYRQIQLRETTSNEPFLYFGQKVPELEILYISAAFHDIVYNPHNPDNEEQSVKVFHELCSGKLYEKYKELIETIIMDTKTHKASNALSEIFQNMDTNIIRSPFSDLLKWEKNIFKEYQFVDYSVYRQERVKFLNKYHNQESHDFCPLCSLIDYIESYVPKVAIYPGSFNPFHIGHLTILQKAQKIFDKVIIAKCINPEKQDQDFYNKNFDLFGVDKPDGLFENRLFPFHQTEIFNGYLIDLIDSLKYQDITIVKGFRNDSDIKSEEDQRLYIEDMDAKNQLKMCYIPCDREFRHVSSTGIRSMEKMVRGSAMKYVLRIV
jgi:pantetheine-phosphate adenylyltransferase